MEQAARLLLLLWLTLSPQPSSAQPEALAVRLVSSPVNAGEDATLAIQTAPAASCRITVLYKSGPSKAR